MTKGLEERLQYVEDMLAIQQALFRYSVGLDTRQYDILNNTFAQDCVFEYGEAGMGAAMTSLAAFVDACDKVFQQLDYTQHTMSSPTITINGDTAQSKTYGLNQHVKMSLQPNHQMLMAGFYFDDWQREADGRWLIHRRRTQGSWASGNPAVVGQKSIRGANASE